MADLHNEAFETALLAALLADNAQIDAVSRVRKEDFFSPVHGELFEAMRELRSEGRAVSPVTLSCLVAPDPLGGPNILDHLKHAQATDSSPHDLADAIIEFSGRRTIKDQGEWLAQQSLALRVKPADILAAHMKEIDALLARSASRRETLFSFADAMNAAMDALQNPSNARRISTGLTDLDALAGGLFREDLTILAGRPSMGKSCVASALGVNVASKGHGVLIFSLEMSTETWLMRVASEATWANGFGIPYADAIRGKLDHEQKETFMRALALDGRRCLP